MAKAGTTTPVSDLTTSLQDIKIDAWMDGTNTVISAIDSREDLRCAW